MAETQVAAEPMLAQSGQGCPHNSGLRFKLSAMMVLQYAIWGAWIPLLAPYLSKLSEFEKAGAIGLIFMTMPIASLIGPFIGGQIADRYLAAEKFLALSHFLGGIVLLVVAKYSTFTGVFVGMLVYNLLYMPTIALTNAIAMKHWPSEQFGKIRAWGSIGWILVGLGLSGWLTATGRPAHDFFYAAAGLSFVLGVYALLLPHTPPAKQGGNPLAFLDAVGMLRNRSFAIIAVISFLVAVEMQFYNVWTSQFLVEGAEVPTKFVSGIMTAGQICEMLMMMLLAVALAKLGYKKTMLVGIAAWALRDFIFSFGGPRPLVLGAVALHGFGFAFFFTTIFMFTDKIAPAGIKSSAQSFLASVSLGGGMLVGSLLTGPIEKMTNKDWGQMFRMPAILLAVCCVVFFLGFREKQESPTSA